MKHNRIYSIIHYWNTFSKNSDKSGQCLWSIGAFLFDLSFQNIMKPKLIKGFVHTLPTSQFAYMFHFAYKCVSFRLYMGMTWKSFFGKGISVMYCAVDSVVFHVCCSSLIFWSLVFWYNGTAPSSVEYLFRKEWVMFLEHIGAL